MANDPATLLPKALRTLLTETLFHASADEAYIINRGEPGLIDTLKSLSAATVSQPPQPGRKPICSHANHVLYGLGLVNRAMSGDMQAFATADWDAAWRLVQVTDGERSDLLRRLEAEARQILKTVPTAPAVDEVMFTGVLGIAAHTAYHLGAVRQILKDVGR